MRYRTTQRGMGLIEIMIALALSVGVLATLFQIFSNSKQNSIIQESLGRMQENGRMAIQTLKQDVRLSGYMGEVWEYWNTSESAGQPLTGVSGACFNAQDRNFPWVAPFVAGMGKEIPPRLFGQNNSKSLFAGCIANENYVANTDVLSIHYGGPQEDTECGWGVSFGCYKGVVYLMSNIFNAQVFRSDGGGAPTLNTDGPNTNIYRVQAHTYYVRPCRDPSASGTATKCDANDDTIPTLVRVRLDYDNLDSSASDGGVVASTEVVAEGVAAMQIAYGLDTGTDGIVNRYVNASSVGDFSSTGNWQNWGRVRTVRLWLLLESEQVFPGYVDQNRYFLDGTEFTGKRDGHRYQLFVTTIAVRNAAGDEA